MIAVVDTLSRIMPFRFALVTLSTCLDLTRTLRSTKETSAAFFKIYNYLHGTANNPTFTEIIV